MCLSLPPPPLPSPLNNHEWLSIALRIKVQLPFRLLGLLVSANCQWEFSIFFFSSLFQPHTVFVGIRHVLVAQCLKSLL